MSLDMAWQVWYKNTEQHETSRILASTEKKCCVANHPSFRLFNYCENSRHRQSEHNSMPIGPSLPPHLAHLTGSSRSPSPPRRPDSSADDEDEDEDEYGPALPPILPSQAGPSHPIPSVPQIPSRPLRPTSPIADDDESDDEIGPKPIPTAGIVQEKSAVEEFLEREARWAKEREVGLAFHLFRCGRETPS